MAEAGLYYIVMLVALYLMVVITNSAYLQCWQYSVNPDLATFGSISDNIGGAASKIVG